MNEPKNGNGKQKINIFLFCVLKDVADCCLLLYFSVNTTVEHEFHILYSGFLGIWMQASSYKTKF